MDDTTKKILAAVIGSALIGLSTWLGGSVMDVMQEQHRIQERIVALEARDGAFEKRMDLFLKQMMELHPMQRSSVALLTWDEDVCPVDADCRDDEDCGSCFCIDGFCASPPMDKK